MIKSKPKWYSVLLLGLAFVLASSIIACGPEKPPPNEEVIWWDRAPDYVGETKVVEGPVVSATWASGSKGKPTFLNMGKPYPDPDRFTVVIWIDSRDKFLKQFPPGPETYFLHKTVRVKGLIETYEGNPQIVLSDPSKIWIVE